MASSLTSVPLPSPTTAADAGDGGVRDCERFLLAYSPVWMLVIGALMFSRRMAQWGNWEHLALGVILALPPLIYGVTRRGYAGHFSVAVAFTTLIQTYFGSELFFNQLGMEYHFHTDWVLNRTPVFLYFLTIAYFSTYYTMMVLLDRQLAKRLKGAPFLIARFAVCYAVAFGETYFMASDLIADFFSYRDRHFALFVGSVGYGLLFFCTLPIFSRLAKSTNETRPPLRTLVRDVFAANMLALCVYEVFAHAVGKPW